MIDRIDLHTHTNCSDGTLSPSKLVSAAVKQGLSAIAITDHDTIDGVLPGMIQSQSLNHGKTSIRVIPGVEISAEYEGRDIHILGLLLDINSTKLKESLSTTLKNRQNRNIKMIEKLNQAGFDVSMEELFATEPNAVITRAHFAKLLTDKKYVNSRAEAFDKYLGSDCPCYVAKEYMKPARAIQIIHEAKGIPVLAHPLLYHFSLDALEKMISLLKNEGLVGLEVIHSSNTWNNEAMLRKLAKRYDLLETGGSDFHGDNKPRIMLGSGTGNLFIPYSLLEKLEDYQKSLSLTLSTENQN